MVQRTSVIDKLFGQGGRRGRREYKHFLPDFSCLTVPKSFVDNLLEFHQLRVSKKFMLKRLCQDFLSEFFCLTGRRKLRREAF